MKKENHKRPWIKPELKVLVKSETEESVLASCKNHGSIFASGPLGADCRSLLGYVCHHDTAS